MILQDGRKRYLYNKVVVDNFIATYVTIEQAAKEFEISPVKIRKWIYEGRLIDKMRRSCKTYFIDRNEILKLIKKTASDKTIL